MTDEQTNAPGPAWPQVWEREQARIGARRAAQGIEQTADDESLTMGLALSGGGIRSATFSLGVMRALAQARALECFDYLSTVSGGGYAGAFFGSLFARPQKPGTERSAGHPYDVLRGPICRPDGSGKNTGWSLWWLRSSGRYLAPTGAGDYVYAAALALRNLTAIHYVLGLTIAIVAAIAIMADETLRLVPGLSAIGRWATAHGGGFAVLAAAAGLLWLLPTGLAYFATEMPKPGSRQANSREWWDSDTWRRMIWIGVFGFAATLIVSPTVAQWVKPQAWADKFGGLLGQLGFIYTGSLKLSVVAGVLSAVVMLSGLFLSNAAEFVEAGKHMPPSQGDEAMRDKSPQGKMLATRVVLTKRLATALKFALILLTLGGLVFVSHWLLTNDYWAWFSTVAGLSGTTLIGLVKKLAGSVPATAASAKPRFSFSTIALVLGFALLAVVAIAWFAFVWGAASMLSGVKTQQLTAPLTPLVGVLALLVPLGLATGAAFQFINLSSIQNLYASRLVRAYLGASNPARADGLDTRWVRISDTHPDDNLPLKAYYDAKNGAPLHLINVTLNETVSPTDPLVQRDRHGRPMSMCPEHLCVDGVWSPRIEDGEAPPDFNFWRAMRRAAPRITKPEPVLPESMSLGSWIGISGAAFSTGIGRGTSIGKSLLLGLANVRLGHWWSAGDLDRKSPKGGLDWVMRTLAKKFQTQAYLVAELLGRFSGRYAPYWYLSDGGHFENTGAYELLRRKVGLILCVDNGADPGYAWDDLANLIRLTRIDFGCEFREVSGVLDSVALAPGAAGRGDFSDSACVRLFWVTRTGSRAASLLVVLKPKLVHGASVDVRQYAQTSPNFPQETTADQFFSEEQWESYRRLGETVGTQLTDALLLAGNDQVPRAFESWTDLRERIRRQIEGEDEDGKSPTIPAPVKPPPHTFEL